MNFMDIIFFALVALLLVWKLRNVLNKDQSFLNKTTDSYGNVGNGMTDSPANSSGNILQVIGFANKNKQSKEALDAVFAFEKLQIDPSLHDIYQSIFEMNPQITISSTCDIARQVYENLIQSLHTKVLSISCNIMPEFAVILDEKIKNIDYSISLMKIDSARVTDISVLGKDVLFIIEIVSQQIVYKEDASQTVTDGSKSIPVTEKEFVHIVRQIGNPDIVMLKAVSV